MARSRNKADVRSLSSSPSPPTTPLPLLAPPNKPMVGATSAVVTTPARRQPMVLRGTGKSKGARCAEVAGGTAADCAAICCCCPCGLVNLLVLVVVKLPTGLCRRVLTKKRRKRRKADGGNATRRGLLVPKIGTSDDDDDDDSIGQGIAVGAPSGRVGGVAVVVSSAVGWPAEKSPSAEVSEMEKEMWARFYGAGFWRSSSQREM